jgi:hypothetical protein
MLLSNPSLLIIQVPVCDRILAEYEMYNIILGGNFLWTFRRLALSLFSGSKKLYILCGSFRQNNFLSLGTEAHRKQTVNLGAK